MQFINVASMLCLTSLLLRNCLRLFPWYPRFGFPLHPFNCYLFAWAIMIVFFCHALPILFIPCITCIYSTYPFLWGIRSRLSMWCNHWYRGHNPYETCNILTYHWWEFSLFWWGELYKFCGLDVFCYFTKRYFQLFICIIFPSWGKCQSFPWSVPSWWLFSLVAMQLSPSHLHFFGINIFLRTG